jgi:pyrroline-5-carboxylate reductase
MSREIATRIGFIGSGRMASALLEGIVRAGLAPADKIVITDKIHSVATGLAHKTGAKAKHSNADVAAEADALILCVKPDDAPPALREAGDLGGKLLISIAAGVPLMRLRQWSTGEPRLIRVMPNTPALIGKGAAAYAAGDGATAADLTLADGIFGAIGTVARVKEELLDAVTGLSGSGPAYVYTVIESLADGGVLMGLGRDIALKLAAQTVLGAAAMVLETGLHPAQLRDQVTSPGGTTIAGIEALEEAGLRTALIAAVRAAAERSKELGATGTAAG